MSLSRFRTLHTTATRLASRSRDPAASASASQPVFKRDAPPAPAPPARPTRPVSATSTPTASAGAGNGSGRSGGKKGSVYASYKALPYNTKLVFWACGAIFATLGLLAADKLEELFPARNNKNTAARSQSTASAKFIDHDTAATQEQGDAKKPKLFSISVVDRSS
ncbi:hypothetical protein sr16387 [Sporisorium reilianum SRZ2]|uniref:Uncharacterized protein n=1 Tax=Sporisorium reilianum (strain SRZ2) TaxID=999809 RepID=E6ZSH5_SPORE|nr:hypothetical protein sr16387 [Sporisorium reilianum SRZ2]